MRTRNDLRKQGQEGSLKMVVRQNWPLRGDPEGGFGFQGPSVCACGFSDVMGSGGRRGAAKEDAFKETVSSSIH